MTVTQTIFEPQASKMPGLTTSPSNEPKKVPEVAKPDSTDAPTLNQDSAILTSSDVKAEQDDDKANEKPVEEEKEK